MSPLPARAVRPTGVHALPRRARSPWSLSHALAAYYVSRAYMLARSGLPQVADLLMVGMLTQLRPDDLRWLATRYFPFFALVAWVCVVNVTWAALEWDREYLVFASYYVFNLLVFTLLARTWVREPEHLRSLLHTGAAVAMVLQLAATLLTAEYRGKGTFNNPNQLAYFTVCALSTYLATAPVRSASRLRDFVVVGVAAWLQVESLSRAGLIACAVVLALWARNLIGSRRTRRMLLAAALAGGFLIVIPEAAGVLPEDNPIAEVVDRFNGRMSTYDEITARNVARIRLYTEYTLLGAGEGGLERFLYDRNNEIHSTFGTLLFSYGVVGLGLFVAFIWQIVRRVPAEYRGYVAAVMLYSLTHNGLRFTYSWMLLALLAGIGEQIARENGRRS